MLKYNMEMPTLTVKIAKKPPLASPKSNASSNYRRPSVNAITPAEKRTRSPCNHGGLEPCSPSGRNRLFVDHVLDERFPTNASSTSMCKRALDSHAL